MKVFLFLPLFIIFSVMSLFCCFPLSMYIFCGVTLFNCALRLYGNYKVIVRGTHKVKPSPETKRARRRFITVAIFLWAIFLFIILIVWKNTEKPEILVSISWLLMALDIIFYSKICLIQLTDSLLGKKSGISCCYVCPIRQWDFLMIATPLVPLIVSMPLMLAPVFLLSAAVLIEWETSVKGILLPDTADKCCVKCHRSCGAEYLHLRQCRRN